MDKDAIYYIYDSEKSNYSSDSYDPIWTCTSHMCQKLMLLKLHKIVHFYLTLSIYSFVYSI